MWADRRGRHYNHQAGEAPSGSGPPSGSGSLHKETSEVSNKETSEVSSKETSEVSSKETSEVFSKETSEVSSKETSEVSKTSEVFPKPRRSSKSLSGSLSKSVCPPPPCGRDARAPRAALVLQPVSRVCQAEP